MKNYFVIHALGKTAENYWYMYIKNHVEKLGFKCFVPTLPPIEKMSYTSWAKAFAPYKQYINEESVFIGHSTGSIFSVRFLMDNNLKINKFIGVVSFNECNTNSVHPDWEEINKTFFVDDLKQFIKHAKTRICFYSPTDIYDFDLLNDFAEKIKAQKVIIEKAGHFTAVTGYDKEFKEIIDYL